MHHANERGFDAQVRAITDEAGLMADAIEAGELAAPVDACPGWDVARVTVHLGLIHRWATDAIRTGSAPTDTRHERPDRAASGATYADWLRTGAERLTEAVVDVGPDAPTWHPFPVEQVSWFWARRQAQETAMHRWDVETALSGSAALDVATSLEGVHEYFDTLLPRVFERESTPPPGTSLHVHGTDSGMPDGAGEWIVWSENGAYRMETAHRKGDAALRGSVVDLLLVLMHRAPIDRLEVVGDPTAADAWLDLPGL